MNQERLLKIILAPVITEKSTNAGQHNQYVFKVVKDANKYAIKLAVEMLFKVKVAKVTVVNLPRKSTNFRGNEGHKGGMRKAYVTLKPGFNIDFTLAEGQK